jgi:hypothetical protein
MSFLGTRILRELNETRTIAERRDRARYRHKRRTRPRPQRPTAGACSAAGRWRTAAPFAPMNAIRDWWNVVPTIDGELWTPPGHKLSVDKTAQQLKNSVSQK